MDDQQINKFAEVHLGTPHDNVCAAISIIQAQILATDSHQSPEVMFGNFYFRTGSLEAAVAMLTPLLEPLETASWKQHSRRELSITK